MGMVYTIVVLKPSNSVYVLGPLAPLLSYKLTTVLTLYTQESGLLNDGITIDVVNFKHFSVLN